MVLRQYIYKIQPKKEHYIVRYNRLFYRLSTFLRWKKYPKYFVCITTKIHKEKGYSFVVQHDFPHHAIHEKNDRLQQIHHHHCTCNTINHHLLFVHILHALKHYVVKNKDGTFDTFLLQLHPVVF